MKICIQCILQYSIETKFTLHCGLRMQHINDNTLPSCHCKSVHENKT